MSMLRKMRRQLSSAQKTVARSAASHTSARCEGFKLEWYHDSERSQLRYFDGAEAHKAWGWYYAKLRASCSWVAIYERQGADFKLLEAAGSMGLNALLGEDIVPVPADCDGSVQVHHSPEGKTLISWRSKGGV